MRAMLGVSLDTLRYDTHRNVIAIAEFDSYIRCVLPCDSPPPNKQLLSSLLAADDHSHKRHSESTSSAASEPNAKRHCFDQKHCLNMPLNQQSQKRLKISTSPK